MAYFQPHEPSSPPSTPAKSPNFGSSTFSTTPAGHPPSSAGSFTPAGNPPSAFGSSVDSHGSNDLMSFSTTSSNFGASQSRDAPFQNLNPRQPKAMSNNVFRGFGGGRTIPRSKLSQSFTPFDNDDNEEEEEQEGEEEDSNEEGMEEDDPEEMDSGEDDPAVPSIFAPVNGGSAGSIRKPLIYSKPDNAKRAKLSEVWAKPTAPPAPVQPEIKKPSGFTQIARDIATRKGPANVDEPDGLLLELDRTMAYMYMKVQTLLEDRDGRELALSDYCEQLVSLWKRFSLESGSVPYQPGRIGPGENSSGVEKASFISTLLLQLYHPPNIQRPAASRFSQSSRSPFRSMELSNQSETRAPFPYVLFDWLKHYHPPRTAKFDALRKQQPNPTSSPTFWNVLLAALLRADIDYVVQLLDAADFNYARSSMEEGSREPGYQGRQLQIIQECVNRAVQILRSSPKLHNDLEITGIEWALFRKQVFSAVAELEDWAEDSSVDFGASDQSFQASHFGLSSLRSSVASFSRSARMAESKIPWSIYQNLKAMYNILLCDVSTILKYSDDWLEATIAITAWWSGDDDGEITLQSCNQPPSKSSAIRRAVDHNAEDAYLARLEDAFISVTDTFGKDGFPVNSMNPVEVGLACIFEGDVQGAIRLMQTWSQAIAASTAEIASIGSWLDLYNSEPMEGLNEEDLMVLNYDQPDEKIDKDDIMSSYAMGLFDRGIVREGDYSREGWEMSLVVVARLDDLDRANKEFNEIIERVPIDSLDKMKLMYEMCQSLGHEEEARKMWERYGDKIAQTTETDEYGTTLYCYARAHCNQKIRNVIEILISVCLVRSIAYPPKAELDSYLRDLIYDHNATLKEITASDKTAANLLQFYFSGYATLRSFYDIRDEEVYLEQGQKPKYRPLARKRAAVQALTAVINSAADTIYGGLYDHERNAAVQVDGLLVLLGECLALIQPDPNQFFTLEQLHITLGAIEDLQTVASRVYDQCEECLQSAMAHYRNHNGSSLSPDGSGRGSPTNLLRKSVSSMSGSFSGFSLVGSEMLESQGRSRGPTDSGVLVPRPADQRDASVKRGWDWREIVSGEIKGEEILKTLRLKLARGLSFGELGHML